ncbi:MAG: M24 family metallopeptidase [Halobacteriaceae archaeon]
MRPTTQYAFLADELAARDAAAVVVIADGTDPTMRYCTRFVGPDRPYAFVFADGDAMLCAPSLFEAQADREFAGDIVYGPDTFAASAPADRAATVLEQCGIDSGSELLVPAAIPHDAALRLEAAGYELASTDAIAGARARKTEAEQGAIERATRIAETGMVAAIEVIEEAVVEGRRVERDGDRLTTGTVRRAANAAIASARGAPAGNTVVGAGRTAADLHFQGDVPIDPGEPVVIDVSPRGPGGYHADMTRTVAVGGEPGWARRAHVAVEAALEAALEAVDPGVRAAAVHEAAAAELRAHGFAIDRGGSRGFVHGTGHGVGLALHERPSIPGDGALEPGHVVTIEPGVYDPSEGGVRLEELVVIGAETATVLTNESRSLSPTAHTADRD